MSNTPPPFTDSVPENYERYLAPVLFRPFAEAMAARVASHRPRRVLELACGTGALTRAMADVLPPETTIVATDISEGMLEAAQRHTPGVGQVTWQVADACALPFEDATFDIVVCQFGAMFFPDKAGALAEASRVLTPGGRLLWTVWGEIGSNRFFESIEHTLASMFPHEETPFMPTPFSMTDRIALRDLAQAAGFATAHVHEETHFVAHVDAKSLAHGFTYGTPLGLYLSAQGYALVAIHSAITDGFTAQMGDPMSFGMKGLVLDASESAA